VFATGGNTLLSCRADDARICGICSEQGGCNIASGGIPIAATTHDLHACLSREDFFAEAAALSSLQLLVILLRITKRHPRATLTSSTLVAETYRRRCRPGTTLQSCRLLLELLRRGLRTDCWTTVLVRHGRPTLSLVRAFSWVTFLRLMFSVPW
jgi:hypothetical protein